MKDNLLMQYYRKVKNIMQQFGMDKIEHIPREKNTKDDSLSKLASCKKQTHHNFVTKQTLHFLTIIVNECLVLLVNVEDCMVLIKRFILAQEKGEVGELNLVKKAASYTIIGKDLFDTSIQMCDARTR